MHGQASSETSIFHPPVDIPIYLSGNFGEIRSTHFHTGIDIKTQQVTGKRIYSIYDGYISRIKIQSGGYGKSLYVTHSNGYVSVYGHLSKFMPEIENYVKRNQYQRKSYEIDLYLKPDEFPVRKGQFIGLSGNTGRSGGPHLHFEIRDIKNQEPLNVLKYNFNIKDNIKPQIYNLAIYPVNKNSRINNTNKKLIVPVESINNHFSIITDKMITVCGMTGFGVETFDFLNGSNNRCGAYSIDLLVNDTLIYSHQIDKLSFNESGYVNSHTDYEEKILNNSKIQKLFVEPNNKLSIYKSLVDRGIYEFAYDTISRIKIIVRDVYQNSSELTFLVKTDCNISGDQIEEIHPDFKKTFYYSTENSYKDDNVEVYLPEDALYDNIDFRYSRMEGDSAAYSDIHCIHDHLTALHKDYTLAIRAKNLPDTLNSKALIGYINTDTTIASQGGIWKDGFIVTRTGIFGNFMILVDTVPPEISPALFNNNGYYSKSSSIAFNITDNLSGIKSYNGYIDDKWALFEYDAKSNTLRYFFDKERIAAGKKHKLEIIVTDYNSNTGKYNGAFYY